MGTGKWAAQGVALRRQLLVQGVFVLAAQSFGNSGHYTEQELQRKNMNLVVALVDPFLGLG